MKTQQPTMRPQDIVILLKIIAYGNPSWLQKPLANALHMSQSEISQSVVRSKLAGLLDPSGRRVNRLALIEFLQYGLRYTFPQQPGPIARGIPTAHSAYPLNQEIRSNEHYVWPTAKGTIRGHSIIPLYPSVINAVQEDSKLYELLALADALRIGRTRERELALKELKSAILHEE